jgi:hypothetical protein
MEKIEELVRYLISPVAFVLLFAFSVAIGGLFIIVGVISYIKLMMSNRRIGTIR